MQNDNIRDKLLRGRLQRDECSNNDVFEFLSLLQWNNAISYETSYKPITKEEWQFVVRKAKRQSNLSIFSKRKYSMHECGLHSKILINILLKYYNVIMQKKFYPL